MVIRVAHSLHHLALDVQLTCGALGTVALLIVGRTIVLAVLAKEAAGGQRLVARGALEARLVEVFVGDAQHLARAFLRALGTVDFRFACKRLVVWLDRIWN